MFVRGFTKCGGMDLPDFFKLGLSKAEHSVLNIMSNIVIQICLR